MANARVGQNWVFSFQVAEMSKFWIVCRRLELRRLFAFRNGLCISFATVFSCGSFKSVDFKISTGFLTFQPRFPCLFRFSFAWVFVGWDLSLSLCSACDDCCCASFGLPEYQYWEYQQWPVQVQIPLDLQSAFSCLLMKSVFVCRSLNSSFSHLFF